jgi:hypothetical protein
MPLVKQLIVECIISLKLIKPKRSSRRFLKL